MKLRLKSIMFAFRAYEIDTFTELDKDNEFLASRLLCNDCNVFWETSLLECFFCNEINYYTFFCKTCGQKTTLTATSTICPSCGAEDPWFPDCVNPDCLSKAEEIEEYVQGKIKGGKHQPGVFGEHSGWNTSNSFCLKCGSSKCKYETHTVSIHEYKNETELQNVLKNISTDALILADPTRPIFDIFIKNSPNSSSFKPKIDKGIDVIIKQLFT